MVSFEFNLMGSYVGWRKRGLGRRAIGLCGQPAHHGKRYPFLQYALLREKLKYMGDRWRKSPLPPIQMSECVICFASISKETGSTTLSCSHTFHYSCITRWLCSQMDLDLSESCPCCRKEVGTYEKIPECLVEYEYDEEEGEEEEEQNDSTMFIVNAIENISARQIQAAWRGYFLRKILRHWNRIIDPSIEFLKHQKAKHIQAIWRGFHVRQLYTAAVTLLRLPRLNR